MFIDLSTDLPIDSKNMSINLLTTNLPMDFISFENSSVNITNF